MPDRKSLIAEMRRAALDAGKVILDIYERGFATERKADGSPVTEADKQAEALILERLAVAAPDIPVVSEENAASHSLAPPERFFLVDPLDGTKEFVSRNGEFTVNIALIEQGVPVLGVVYAPIKGQLFWVDADGHAVEERDGAPDRHQRTHATGSRPHRRRQPLALDEASTKFLNGYKTRRHDLGRAPRSNSACWRAARPTSIPASGGPWNGTRRRATRCCGRPAGAC